MAFNTPSMILPHVFLAENIQKLMKNKLWYDICGFLFNDIYFFWYFVTQGCITGIEHRTSKKEKTYRRTWNANNSKLYVLFIFCVCVCSTLFVFWHKTLFIFGLLEKIVILRLSIFLKLIALEWNFSQF